MSGAMVGTQAAIMIVLDSMLVQMKRSAEASALSLACSFLCCTGGGRGCASDVEHVV